MGTYLMMLYVTVEQERAVKDFFDDKGWEFCKPDLSVLTDRLGPYCKPDGTDLPVHPGSGDKPAKSIAHPATPKPVAKVEQKTPASSRPVRTATKRRFAGLPLSSTAPFVKSAKLSHTQAESGSQSDSTEEQATTQAETADVASDVEVIDISKPGRNESKTVEMSTASTQVGGDEGDSEVVMEDEGDDGGESFDDGDNDDDFVDSDLNGESYDGQDSDDESFTVKEDATSDFSQESQAGTSGTRTRSSGGVSTRSNYQCSVCGMRCKTIMLLKEHHKRHPDNVEVCLECGGQFDSLDVLEEHTKFHLNEKASPKSFGLKMDEIEVLCGRCGEYVKNLLFHLRSCDADVGENPTCKKCEQRFVAVEYLIEHIPKCKVGPFKCPVCNIPIKRKSSYRRHLRHHDPEGATIECKVCDKKFYQNWDLLEHMKRHTPKVNCESCGKPVSNTRTHMKVCKQALADKNLVRCRNCDKVFSSMEEKRQHMDSCQPGMFECDVCGMSYTQAGSLRLHQNKHHGMAEGKFQCAECGMKFFLKHQLEEHAHIHRPKVRCETCGKMVYPTKRHQKLCRSPKIHECPHCSAQVRGTNSHLRRHIDRHHPEFVSRENTNIKYMPAAIKKTHRFQCDTCGDSFLYKGWLEAHMTNCRGINNGKPKEVIITNLKDVKGEQGETVVEGEVNQDEVEVAMMLPSVLAETEAVEGGETMLTDLATNTVYIIKH